MAPRIVEIKLYRQGRNRAIGEPWLTSIDLEKAEATADMLNRHLLGGVLRDGGDRKEMHLYYLETHEIDNDGKGRSRVLWRWALPAADSV